MIPVVSPKPQPLSLAEPLPLKKVPQGSSLCYIAYIKDGIAASRSGKIGLAMVLITFLYFLLSAFPAVWASLELSHPKYPLANSRIFALKNIKALHHPHQQAYVLTKKESVAALTAFILSPLHSNSLPLDGEIQMENLVGFNLNAGEKTKHMVDDMVDTIWKNEKLVVFGKFRHPPTRALKSFLKKWDMPIPSTIELDTREDGEILEQLLKSLVTTTDNEDSWTLPLLIVHGTPILGGLESIIKLGEEGTLWTENEKKEA